jgi:3-hydroxybutyryl-CoA dehydrogenase
VYDISDQALGQAKERLTKFEAIPEVAKIKTDFYTQLGKVAPEKTIFATDSSTLLPSQFAEVTGRPDKFLALHFASDLWKNNTAEVMKHLGTDQKVRVGVVIRSSTTA